MSRKMRYVMGAAMAVGLTFFGTDLAHAASRIHYIGLKGSTDAILLEDEGRFALVDSGEDWDYPTELDGVTPPRPEIVTDQGFEEQVIYYMESVGVNDSNLDFYIGSHAHSDHIGSGDEIIQRFRPKKLYLKKYSDENVTVDNNRWDNQDVYDNILKAAKKSGTEVIQELEEGMEIPLGEQTTLKFYNTQVRKKVKDENANSLVVKASVYDTDVLLTGDLEPAVARALIEEGSIGGVDILKLPHHGYVENNPPDILQSFSPKLAVVTGPISNLAPITTNTLRQMNTRMRSTYSSGASLINEFSKAGYSTSYHLAPSGWLNYKKHSYYMDENCQALTGLQQIEEQWYLFNEEGQLQTGWQEMDGESYYFQPDGENGSKGRMVKETMVEKDGFVYCMNPEDGSLMDVRMTARSAEDTLWLEASMHQYNSDEQGKAPYEDLSFRLKSQTAWGDLVYDTWENDAGEIAALALELTGEMNLMYDIYYQVQLEEEGWLGWTSNGEIAGDGAAVQGEDGQAVTGVRVQIYPKDGSYGSPDSGQEAMIGETNVPENTQMGASQPEMDGWQQDGEILFSE